MVRMTRRFNQLETSSHKLPFVAVGIYEVVPPAPQIVQVPLPRVSYGAPFQLFGQFETTPPHATMVTTAPYPTVPIIEDVRLIEQEAMMERLDTKMR